jgi:hypothetical protein
MANLGLVDIAPELLQEMSDRLKHKQQCNTEVMQCVAAHMNLKPCEDTQFSQVNSMALALTVNTHTTEGNQLLCSITSVQVQLELDRAWEEFHMLAVHLQELALDHAIFDKMALSDEAMDKLAPLGSQRSQKMHGLYKKIRNNSIYFYLCMNDIEQSAPMATQNPGVPPPNNAPAK